VLVGQMARDCGLAGAPGAADPIDMPHAAGQCEPQPRLCSCTAGCGYKRGGRAWDWYTTRNRASTSKQSFAEHCILPLVVFQKSMGHCQNQPATCGVGFQTSSRAGWAATERGDGSFVPRAAVLTDSQIFR
jgi:hypothetical protein